MECSCSWLCERSGARHCFCITQPFGTSVWNFGSSMPSRRIADRLRNAMQKWSGEDCMQTNMKPSDPTRGECVAWQSGPSR
eukprot:5376638-Prymnesium_polylepis.1